MVEYHVDMLPQFQDIVDKSGEKGNFGGWLSVRMNMGELPVVCLGKQEEIFKHYIFTKNMCTNKGTFQIVPNDDEYGFGYPLTVPYLQTVN